MRYTQCMTVRVSVSYLITRLALCTDRCAQRKPYHCVRVLPVRTFYRAVVTPAPFFSGSINMGASPNPSAGPYTASTSRGLSGVFTSLGLGGSGPVPTCNVGSRRELLPKDGMVRWVHIMLGVHLVDPTCCL
jgi:hypothetical protein